MLTAHRHDDQIIAAVPDPYVLPDIPRSADAPDGDTELDGRSVAAEADRDGRDGRDGRAQPAAARSEDRGDGPAGAGTAGTGQSPPLRSRSRWTVIGSRRVSSGRVRANYLTIGLWVCIVVSVVVGTAAGMKAWPIMVDGTGDNGQTALAVGGAHTNRSATTPAPSITDSHAPSAPVVAPPAPSATATSSAPSVATFTAVSGEGCPITATGGFRRSGMNEDWYTRARGGWTGDGCGGQVVAVPMSGDVSSDDNDNVVMWWFTPNTLNSGTCAVSVYVPDTGNPLDAAGAPAHYKAFSSANGAGATIGEFDVDQTAHRGQWVSAARLPLNHGQLSISMVTRGIDWGAGRDGAHLGAAAARVNCQANS